MAGRGKPFFSAFFSGLIRRGGWELMVQGGSTKQFSADNNQQSRTRPTRRRTTTAPHAVAVAGEGAGSSTQSAWDTSKQDLLVQAVTLDFEARVPVPFSIFPSSYKGDKTNQASATTEVQTHEEVSFHLPTTERPGREGQLSSFVDESSSRYTERVSEPKYEEEEVRVTREEEHYHRPGVRRREDRHRKTFSDTTVAVRRDLYTSPIDAAERQYRSRYQPNYNEDVRSHTNPAAEFEHSGRTHSPRRSHAVETVTTVDTPIRTSASHTELALTKFVDTKVVKPKTAKMGYYDEDTEHQKLEVAEMRSSSVGARRSPSPVEGGGALPPNTVTIPCHHIRIGDILMLQGRPCQVIRISTSAATGQHRYLGVDLFTKKLHEESSFVTSPAPSVVVQTMLGPILKQYRVLDLQDGNVVAMTETGDVKQDLPVIDQSNLWTRLTRAFESGRGSVRVLVVSDHGRELCVDLKVVHGVSL
ncbi:woronin body major protein [Grosmannia clavigera kw1407]|uniref:Woronin body major protein n=1 Tax=Grosmannia clavigera (strain kw1407 / UAMH 11150) TaxID=655863 RepID=F0XK09_GROCL|nr:woronin body major protein [Grosmannia clavigera kw1407]EFX01958.1 woronin body major protein [Grosmannia clavigera kw1407]